MSVGSAFVEQRCATLGVGPRRETVYSISAGKPGEWGCASAAQEVPRQCLPTVLAKVR
jgi:hypothetical protein